MSLLIFHYTVVEPNCMRSTASGKNKTQATLSIGKIVIKLRWTNLVDIITAKACIIMTSL